MVLPENSFAMCRPLYQRGTSYCNKPHILVCLFHFFVMSLNNEISPLVETALDVLPSTRKMITAIPVVLATPTFLAVMSYRYATNIPENIRGRIIVFLTLLAVGAWIIWMMTFTLIILLRIHIKNIKRKNEKKLNEAERNFSSVQIELATLESDQQESYEKIKNKIKIIDNNFKKKFAMRRDIKVAVLEEFQKKIDDLMKEVERRQRDISNSIRRAKAADEQRELQKNDVYWEKLVNGD